MLHGCGGARGPASKERLFIHIAEAWEKDWTRALYIEYTRSGVKIHSIGIQDVFHTRAGLLWAR